MSGIITENMLETFRKYLYYNEKSTATIKKYFLALQEFQKYLNGKAFTKERFLQYRDFLLEKKKPQTVNGKISAINAYLNFCGRPEMKIKLLKVQRQMFIPEEKELTMNEYRRLLETAKREKKERIYMIMLTLAGTGIRISELKYITVESVCAGKADIHMKGKCRTILLQKKLCEKLLAYARKRGTGTGIIFCTRTGRPVDRSNICHEMKRLCEHAGVAESKVFPHNFRHLFARAFYAVEKNLSHLADVLGHSQIETTRIYVAASTASHERIMEKMNLIL